MLKSNYKVKVIVKSRKNNFWEPIDCFEYDVNEVIKILSKKYANNRLFKKLGKAFDEASIDLENSLKKWSLKHYYFLFFILLLYCYFWIYIIMLVYIFI